MSTSLPNASIEDCESLRNALKDAEDEVLALRNQYKQLRDLLKKRESEAKQASEELHDAKEKEQQLERIIQFLRKRTEESHSGGHDFDGQYQKIQASLKSVTEELDRARHEIQDLNQALDEERHQSSQFEKALKNLQVEHEKVITSAQTKQQRDFENELRERDASIETLRNDLTLLRQQALNEIQAAQKDLLDKENTLKQSIENKEQELASKEEEYQIQIRGLHDERLYLVRKIEETAATAQEKGHIEEAYHKLQAEFQHLSHRFQELTTHSKSQIEDLETRLRIAQQHLAKRVREGTILNEKYEEQRAKILELQSQLSESKLKALDLQNTLEVELQHQKRLQEKLTESLNLTESKLEKWEQKYFLLHEQWQDAEEDNRKLKRIEIKFNEMQTLLSQLGKVIGQPMILSALPTIQQEVKKEKDSLDTP